MPQVIEDLWGDEPDEAERYEAERYEAERYEAERYEAERYEAERYEAERYDPAAHESAGLGIVFRHQVRLPEKAVLLRLQIGAWGISKRLAQDQFEIGDADKSLARANRRTIESEELDAVISLDNRVRAWVRSRTLPSSFKGGIYLLPAAAVVDVDDYLVDYEANRAALINLFLRVYPYRRDDMMPRLKHLYDPMNYPHPRRMPSLFYVERDYMEITSAPGTLQHIKPELFRAEQEKAARKWATAVDSALVMLRGEFSGMVEHMEHALEPDEIGADGKLKRKRFYDSLLTNWQEWLGAWQARNSVINDAELDRWVRRAEDLLEGGITTSDLRNDTEFRAKLKESFAAIGSGMVNLTTAAPSRVILLAGDGEDED